MRNRQATIGHWFLLAGIGGGLMFGSVDRVSGQPQGEVEVRDLGRTSWEKKRGGAPPKRADKYRITKRMPKDAAIPLSAEDSEVGVTLWRLRPARTDDAVEIRDLVQRAEGAAKETWTAERVAADTEFSEGQMVRLSIESLRTGFLYVINRAKYKDGTHGDPYLIFPTKQIYGGDNKVQAGRAIQIPGPDEEPFVLERSKSREGELQESEELWILVTPQPLQSFLVAPPDRQKLAEPSVENLIKKYAAPFDVSENMNGAGRAITVAEKRAAKTADKGLGAEDPYPQTIYRVAIKPGDAMLIKVELKVQSRANQ